MRRLPRGRAVRTAALTLAVAAPLVLAAVVGEGSAVRQVEQHAGGAWLASPGLGYVTLVDGPSRVVAATVAVAQAGHRVQVTQAGSSAYVVDATAGVLSRVDGALQQVSRAVEAADPGNDLRVTPGGGAVWLVDATQRVAAQVDPRSLTAGRASALAAVPGPGQAVVDDDGTLWVVDSLGGGLVRVRADAQERVATVPPDAGLLLVKGAPVLVRTGQRTVAPLRADGQAGPATCLDVRPGDAVQLLGSAHRDQVVAAVSHSGTLLISDLRAGSCDRVVRDVGATGGAADFGPLAEMGPFVFVPDRATGRVTVVDTRRDEVATTFELAEPGHEIELVAKDGLVFYNDLGGQRAGVLTLEDGRWRDSPVDKYDPESGAPAVPVVPPDAEPFPAAPEPQDTPPDAVPPTAPAGAAPPGTAPTRTPPPGTSPRATPGPGTTASPGPGAAGVTVDGPTDVVAGEDATFRVVSAGDPVTRTVWDFGDGTRDDVDGATATHRWSTARTEPYPLTVTVTTADGRTVTVTSRVRVGDRPPVLLTVTSPTGGAVVDASDASGIDCPDRCTATYPPGSTVTLRPEPEIGQWLAAWTGACEDVSPRESCTLTLTEPVTVGAVFERDPALARTITVEPPTDGSIVSEDGRIDCPGQCLTEYGEDRSLTLRAYPAGRLADWGGDCDGSTGATCTIEVTDEHTVDATFEACRAACVTFERLPGQPVLTDSLLVDPDAFASVGLVGLRAAPASSYCAEAVAGLEPRSLGGHRLPDPVLTTRDPSDAQRCNTVFVDVGFANPAAWVSLRFTGAAEPYVLTAFAPDGTVVGTTTATPSQPGAETTAEISGARISRVTLGFTTGLIAVSEIQFDGRAAHHGDPGGPAP